MSKILYLCNGDMLGCKKTNCYKRGGPCRHTDSAASALNPESQNLVEDSKGNLWERDDEEQKEERTST